MRSVIISHADWHERVKDALRFTFPENQSPGGNGWYEKGGAEDPPGGSEKDINEAGGEEAGGDDADLVELKKTTKAI